jgi:hypothetical protein
MGIGTQIFPSTAGDEARVGDGRSSALQRSLAFAESKPVLWKAERDADRNVDAHSACSSVRGAHAQSRREAGGCE